MVENYYDLDSDWQGIEEFNWQDIDEYNNFMEEFEIFKQ